MERKVVRVGLWDYVETKVCVECLEVIKYIVYAATSILMVSLLFSNVFIESLLMSTLFRIGVLILYQYILSSDILSRIIVWIYRHSITVYFIIKHEMEGSSIPYREQAKVYRSRRNRQYAPIVYETYNISFVLFIVLYLVVFPISAMKMDRFIWDTLSEMLCLLFLTFLRRDVALKIINEIVGN